MEQVSEHGTAHDTNSRGDDVNLRSGPQMLEYEAIVAHIATRVEGPILDWGCGWGQVTDLLRRGGLDVESYDYAEGEPLRTVELPRFAPARAQISGDPVALPYADGHFAAVLSCGVLEHVPKPGGSLHELRRILRPGGRLFVYKLPNRFSYLEAIARHTGLYYHGMLPFDRLYDLRSAASLVEHHGFRVESVRRANMLPLTLTPGWAVRNARLIWRANRALARVPALNVLATNVEPEAVAA